MRAIPVPPIKPAELQRMRKSRTVAPILRVEKHLLDEEVRPDPNELHFSNINWQHSVIALSRPSEQVIKLTPWGRQWTQLEAVEVSVPDLKENFGFRLKASESLTKRGRPPKHDWAAIEAKARELLLSSVPPRSQAELCERIAEWCQDTGRELPSSSLLNEHLGAIWRAEKKVKL